MNASGKIRVIVVDDSAVFRGFWSRVIDASPDMELVTAAMDGMSGLLAVRKNDADVLMLDIEMPGMTGLEALPLILSEKPNLKVIIASGLTREASKTAIEALALGASDFIGKPSSLGDGASTDTVVNELRRKIRALTQKNRIAKATFERPPNRIHSSEGGLVDLPPGEHFKPQLLVIGTSTGGPNALSHVMSRLGAQFSLPTLIVQHMPPEFTKMLAQRLAKDSGRLVKEAEHGEIVKAGSTYVGPGDFHMEIVRNSSGEWIIQLNQHPPIHFCRPAVDRLFASAAKLGRGEVLAVIMTGMGEDGRDGCELVRESGGVVIAQDEASSVVWGMPGAVVRSGLANYVCSLDEIHRKIESVVNG